MHLPHLMHLLWSISNGERITPVMALTGHCLEQSEQPLHLSGMILYCISFLQTFAGHFLSLICASYSSRKWVRVETMGLADV